MLGIYDNEMNLEFVSKSSNEAFARIAVAAFASQLDPINTCTGFLYPCSIKDKLLPSL